MTPLLAAGPPEVAADAVASPTVWARHVAVIRAYYGDGWFAGRSVLPLGFSRGIDELVALGARAVGVKEGFDPDREWPCGQVDLVLHLGLPQMDASHASLRHACAHASDLVIDTAVCDSHDPDVFISVESDQSSPELRPCPGVYSAAARIEKLLADHGMLFQRLADSRCNDPSRIYDWLAAGTDRVTPGQRRLWFARRA